ncbi:hypothetical protein M8J77_013458 [Diaphorina citri]|nr:hypothetical protein M8J77_013458 [Diaphorina citri]
MYSVMVICLFGFVTVDSTYSSDGLLFNAEDSPLWKSSNGVVFLRPPSRRSIEASTNHNKDAQDMKWLGLGKRAEAKLTPYISVGGGNGSGGGSENGGGGESGGGSESGEEIGCGGESGDESGGGGEKVGGGKSGGGHESGGGGEYGG